MSTDHGPTTVPDPDWTCLTCDEPPGSNGEGPLSPEDAEFAAVLAFNREVSAEVRRVRVRKAAVEVIHAEERAAQGKALTNFLLDRAELVNLPKPEPLIIDTLDQRTVGILYGNWGTCKSFVAQHWAASVATGTHWQGRRAHRRKVLYIAAEGAHGLDDRLTAWEIAWRAKIDPAWLTVLRVPVQLANPTEFAELLALVVAGGYGLVIIDTLARCMVGLDESSSKDMGQVIAAMYELMEAMPDGGTVLGVHHTGKDKTTFRGSSAGEGNVDTLYMTEGDPQAVTLKRTKRKDGPPHDLHALRLRPIEGTASCVLEAAGGVELGSQADTLLSHVKSHFSETGATPTQLRDLLPDMPKTTFYRALNDLVSRGALHNSGTDKRAFYTLPGTPDE